MLPSEKKVIAFIEFGSFCKDIFHEMRVVENRRAVLAASRSCLRVAFSAARAATCAWRSAFAAYDS